MNKIKVEVEVEVDQDWIDLLTKHSDMFSTDHCGYWMYGMERTDELGWLCFEHDDDVSIRDVASHPEYASTVKLWKEGKPLPEKWFRLDKDAAIKAYTEGCKRSGVNWYENGDANDYDVAIQMALLGEVRYG